jgi:DUF1680 family protein
MSGTHALVPFLGLAVMLCSAALAATDTSLSPHVTMRSIGMRDVRWTDGLWAQRTTLCRQTMVPTVEGALHHPENAANLDNFLVAAGLQKGKHRGKDWGDGDCYKWLEALAHVYAMTGDRQTDALMDLWIDAIAKAQNPDGYLSTNIQLTDKQRFVRPNLHEMYNMGHLLTAACVHHRATGKTTFLAVARKLADCLYRNFRETETARTRFGWNPSQIMGLVDLHRVTREKRYLELAGIFVSNRGRAPAEKGANHAFGGTDQTQDRVPLRKETHAVGHAVTGTYLWCGAADVAAEIGDRTILEALERLWLDVTERKMDITGSVGYGNGKSERGDSLHEAFGHPYQLPNRYNETCSNIGNAMWSWRMLGLTGDARYADLVELVLHNSFASTFGLDGKTFFYCNPLVWQGEVGKHHHTGERWTIHHCYCCPTNVIRTLAKLHGWFYSVSDDGLWVHQYGGNILRTKLPDGPPAGLTQETDYPWDGRIRITIDDAPGKPMSIRVRIPGWVEGAALEVNGEPIAEPIRPGTYVAIRRTWTKRDTVDLHLPMPVRLMEANPKAEELHGKVAVMRGPVVYCLELPRKNGGAEAWQTGVFLPENVDLTPRPGKDEFADMTVLEGSALTFAGRDRFVRDTVRAAPPAAREWGRALYRTFQPRELPQPAAGTVPISLIPYFAWANRGQSFMEVWIPLAR